MTGVHKRRIFYTKCKAISFILIVISSKSKKNSTIANVFTWTRKASSLIHISHNTGRERESEMLSNRYKAVVFLHKRNRWPMTGSNHKYETSNITINQNSADWGLICLVFAILCAHVQMIVNSNGARISSNRSHVPNKIQALGWN